MPRRALETVGLVDDQQIEPRRDGVIGEARCFRKGVDAEDGVAVRIERVERLSEVPGDVGEPLLVEEDEDLVVLPPELAEPLNGQGLRGDDEAARGAPRADQVVQDEARLDRLAEADLVGEEPPDGFAPRRPLRDVDLVREEMDPASKKEPRPSASRSEARCSASRRFETSSIGSISPARGDRRGCVSTPAARGLPPARAGRL